MHLDDSSNDDFGSELPPATLSQGELSPPPRKPPTAVSAAPAGPEPTPPRPRIGRTRRSPIPREIVKAVDTALGVLDDVGDAIRGALARAVS